MTEIIGTNSMIETLSSQRKSPNGRLGLWERMLRPRVLSLLFALGAILPGRAAAYDGVTVGQVAFIELGSNEVGFGIQLVGGPSLCTNPLPGSAWAGIASRYGDPEEVTKANLAIVTAAKLSGASIRVYAYNNDNGTCHIGAIDLL